MKICSLARESSGKEPVVPLSAGGGVGGGGASGTPETETILSSVCSFPSVLKVKSRPGLAIMADAYLTTLKP